MPPSPADPQLPGGYEISIRNIIGITLLAVLVFVILGVIVVQLDPTIFKEGRDAAQRQLWFALLATTGIVAATAYVLAWRTAQKWGIIGMLPAHPRWYLIAAGTGAVLFFLTERADDMLSLNILADFRGAFAASLKTESGIVSLLAARALLFPVALEIYFRGVLLNFLIHRIGMQAGIGLAALVFALLFYRPDAPGNMIFGLVNGIVYSLLFLRSGSLYPAMVANGTVGALIVAKAAWA